MHIPKDPSFSDNKIPAVPKNEASKIPLPSFTTTETFIQKLDRLKRERQQRDKEQAEIVALAQAAEVKRVLHEKQAMLPLGDSIVPTIPASPALSKGQFSQNIELNDEQKMAVRNALDFSIPESVIFGSAGTGKTTLLRQMVTDLAPLLPQFGHEHKHLSSAAPAIAVVSYTRRAVKNLRRALTGIGMKSICCTIHKLLEYAPEQYSELNSEGEMVQKMRFSPSRCRSYPLTGLKFLIVDEAGMDAVELDAEVREALPADCRIVYLGDIYQLPPVYGSAILGFKLADAARGTIPYVHLQHVYRQALDSPILRFALKVKDGVCPEFNAMYCKAARTWESPKKDSVLKVMPISEVSDDPEFLSSKFGAMFAKSYTEGRFNPDEDVILIPHGKPHTFGSHALNLHIAQAITDKNSLDVYEVFSGFNKLYLSIGDKIAIGPHEGRIKEIVRNGKYYGKFPRPPGKSLDRWGRLKLGQQAINAADVCLDGTNNIGGKVSLDQIDAFLDAGRLEDRKAQCSHVVTIQLEDSTEEMSFSTAAELNLLTFTYALTCHKAQGAEWRRVYIILHHVHANMYSREWLYTAMTRAREECVILARPMALEKCVSRAMITGTTLAEKAEFFKGKQKEKDHRDMWSAKKAAQSATQLATFEGGK